MFLFIRRFFDKFKVKETIEQVQATTVLRRQCELMWLALQHESNDFRYAPHVAGSILVQVTHTDIDQLIVYLREINQAVHSRQVLKPETMVQFGHVLSVDEFFISADGYYIPQERIKELLAEALKLCAQTAEYDSAEFGVEEHNRRMLNRLFTSLKSLATGLLEAVQGSR